MEQTDKEKAEKYAENKYYCNQLECIQGNGRNCDFCYLEESERDYLAGLAEGRKEKWHDLRKNPNDLPEENEHYWCYVDDGVFHTDYGVIYFEDGKWESEKWKNKTIVIAWCELPKFEE